MVDEPGRVDFFRIASASCKNASPFDRWAKDPADILLLLATGFAVLLPFPPAADLLTLLSLKGDKKLNLDPDDATVESGLLRGLRLLLAPPLSSFFLILNFIIRW